MSNTIVGPPNFDRYNDTRSEYRDELMEFAKRLIGVINKNEDNKEVLKVCRDLLTPMLPVLDFEFPYSVGLGFGLDDWLEFLIDDNKEMANSQAKSIVDNLDEYFKTKPIYSGLN